MAHERHQYDVPVGTRVDGTPWQLRIIEHRGSAGPATAILGGMFGDKAISSLAVHELDRILTDARDLAGTVLLAPAINLPGLEQASRINADHLALNRRFPGSPRGFLTDQFADAVAATVLDAADCVLDLHSGTPTMALWYTYDYGDLELSASFGYLPVATGFGHPGQLGTHASSAGAKLLLPEWGGGPLTSMEAGIEGSLNVLRYRGHLAGGATGPATVPLIRERSLMLASNPGIFESAIDAGAVGTRIDAGLIGWITNASTGERMEEFRIDEEGSILMMAATAPAVVQPGDFTFMAGTSEEDLDVPNVSP